VCRRTCVLLRLLRVLECLPMHSSGDSMIRLRTRTLVPHGSMDALVRSSPLSIIRSHQWSSRSLPWLVGYVSGTPTFLVNGVNVAADSSWTLQQWRFVLDPLFAQHRFKLAQMAIRQQRSVSSPAIASTRAVSTHAVCMCSRSVAHMESPCASSYLAGTSAV
jgi:hypothetical protein